MEQDICKSSACRFVAAFGGRKCWMVLSLLRYWPAGLLCLFQVRACEVVRPDLETLLALAQLTAASPVAGSRVA